MKRRTLIHTVGASIGLGTVGAGSIGLLGSVSADDHDDYAEVTFSDGTLEQDRTVDVDSVTMEPGGYLSIHTVTERLNTWGDIGDPRAIANSFVGISSFYDGETSPATVYIHPSPNSWLEDWEDHYHGPYKDEFANEVAGSALPGVAVTKTQPVLAIPHTTGDDTNVFVPMQDVAFRNGPKRVGALPVVNDIGTLHVER